MALLALGGCAPPAPAARAGDPGGGVSARAPTAVPPAGPGQAAPGASNPYLPRPDEPPIPLKIGHCSVSGTALQYYTGVEGGVFARYGLDVERVVLSSVPAALAALVNNEVQLLYCAVDATASGLGSGMDAKLVAAPLVGLPYVFVARPDTAMFADLRGKSIGITRPGDLDERLARLALERHGLQPGVDVEMRPIGGSQPERYRALVANVVQGIVITPPLNAQAVQDGMVVLYDLADLGVPFVSNAIQANGTLLREQPGTVQRFVAAAAEAAHLTSRQPALARAALTRVVQIDDPATLDAAYQAYAVKHANPRLRFPMEAVDAALDAARAAGTPISVQGAADVATNAFADDLERSGFLAQLWGAELPPR